MAMQVSVTDSVVSVAVVLRKLALNWILLRVEKWRARERLYTANS